MGNDVGRAVLLLLVATLKRTTGVTFNGGAYLLQLLPNV